MVTKTQIIVVLLLIYVVWMIIFVKNKRKKSILIAVGGIFFLYMLGSSIFMNNKYYFSYSDFYKEFENVKVGNAEDFLIDPQTVDEIGEMFDYYHRESWFGRGEYMSVSFFVDSDDYKNWSETKTIQIDDMNQKGNERIQILESAGFRTCCEDFVKKVASQKLDNENYYFQKLYHGPNLVYGIILDDDTCEVIQFYYFW